MNYKLQDDGLYCQVDKQWHRIGGWIRVLARTRLFDKRRGHGALLEWQNLDGVNLREVIYARDLNGDQARQVREMLVDTGYPLMPGQQSWGRLQHYLLNEMVRAKPAVVLNRSGWHNSAFALGGSVLGETMEPHYFVGELDESTRVGTSGSLEDWQKHIGTQCRGNPLAIFSVGVGLAAPLLALVGMENGAFHLVGASSTGKTTLQRIACSAYGAPPFLRSWVSTGNGLEAVASRHHDLILLLDEIGLARPEDVDRAIYQIMNGVGKLRATISGDLAPVSSWRTLVLSSGEVWISEVLEKIGKQVRAGQQTRLVEIPIFGNYGAFSDLHGSRSAGAFVERLNTHCSKYYGTLFPKWIALLQQTEGLQSYLVGEVGRWTESWSSKSMASQAGRVVKRFALVAVALCLCCRNFLLPWSERDSQVAVHRVLTAWIKNRGHTKNVEEFRILKALEAAMHPWERSLSGCGTQHAGSIQGLRRDVNGRELWLIEKGHFLTKLHLPTQYMREVQILIERQCLLTNEPARGTYRAKIDGELRRFFALWPDQVRLLLAEIDGEHDDQ